MNTSYFRPCVVRSERARVLRQLPGETITILLSCEETGGSFAMCMDENAPGGGSPLHIHRREDETFHVLEGVIEFQVGHEKHVLTAGDSVFAPRGIPHAFRNVGKGNSRTLFLITPAGLEDFFVEVEPLLSGSEPDMAAVFSIAERYGIELMQPVDVEATTQI
ncbi:MAG: cupin domain-containing protein [Candidatus Promineifilaceae bacterium]|nr:cupin domain-containing protein [Candidatus Promineifilaceae bacterium]